MPNGYWDRILHVDLSSRTTRVESFGEAFWRRHLGGRSLIAHYLLTEVPIGTDPLSPDNVLIFAAGVLTGTPFPGAGRHSVGAKSPMTGLFGESEAGGVWGAELRHAGWDAIRFHGPAGNPGYPLIKDDQGELLGAASIWRLETARVEDAPRSADRGQYIRVAL